MREYLKVFVKTKVMRKSFKNSKKRKQSTSKSPNQVLDSAITYEDDSDCSSNFSVKPSNKKAKKVLPTVSQAQAQDNNSSISKPKPIFAQTNIQVIKNFLLNVSIVNKPLLKLVRANQVQISCHSTEDKAKIIEKLKIQQIQFYTFTEKIDKPIVFLLKGFYVTDCDEIKKLLLDKELPVVKVSHFIKREDFAIYSVHFQGNINNININILNHSHRIIDSIVVKWEVIKSNSKRPSQCHNCQRFGHASYNCGFKFRCVKCSEDHSPGDCKRSVRDENVYCVNCKGQHAANHRGCSVFQKFKSNLDNLRSNSARPVAKSLIQQRLRISDPVEFPALVSTSLNANRVRPVPSNHVSFSQSPNESSFPLFNKLSLAQERLKSLPEIDETINLFVNMVEELSNTNDHKARCAILMKYCLPNSNFHHES